MFTLLTGKLADGIYYRIQIYKFCKFVLILYSEMKFGENNNDSSSILPLFFLVILVIFNIQHLQDF